MITFEFDSDGAAFTTDKALTKAEAVRVEAVLVELEQAFEINISREVEITEAYGRSWPGMVYNYKFEKPLDYSEHVEDVYEQMCTKYQQGI